MSLTTPSSFHCPYCMEPNNVEIDEMNDIDVMQVTDCQVCCQPIEMTITRDGDTFYIQAEREND